jgi:hypothetical protein
MNPYFIYIQLILQPSVVFPLPLISSLASACHSIQQAALTNCRTNPLISYRSSFTHHWVHHSASVSRFQDEPELEAGFGYGCQSGAYAEGLARWMTLSTLQHDRAS